MYMLWFNFYFGLKFSNQFNFHFPLFQIMVMNLKQKKIKLNWFETFKPPKKLNHNTYIIPPGLLICTYCTTVCLLSEIMILAVCFQLKQLKKQPEKNSGLNGI